MPAPRMSANPFSPLNDAYYERLRELIRHFLPKGREAMRGQVLDADLETAARAWAFLEAHAAMRNGRTMFEPDHGEISAHDAAILRGAERRAA